jgi:F0F1-type ATP synthase membrane subunit b/b'
MNKNRRDRLSKLADLISEFAGKLEDAVSEAESLRDEEQEAFDAMPESLQQTDRGQASEAAISAIEELVSSLETARDSLQEGVDHANTAGE